MSRQRGNRIPNIKAVYFFTEGETEKAYFTKINNEFSNIRIQSFCVRGHGVKLLEEALSLFDKKKPPLDEKALSYIIFDNDKDHVTKSSYEKAVSEANKKNFGIGFSNSSFEVWLLAHFEKLGRQVIPQKSLEQKLTNKLGSKYKKADLTQIDKIVKSFKIAITNAEHIEEIDFNFQCTNIGKIIKDLKSKYG